MIALLSWCKNSRFFKIAVIGEVIPWNRTTGPFHILNSSHSCPSIIYSILIHAMQDDKFLVFMIMENDDYCWIITVSISLKNQVLFQVYGVAFSPDRSQLLSCSEDGTIRLWSLQTWSCLVAYKGHMFSVWQVRFANTGYYFASCGHDKTARLWTTVRKML